MKRRSFFSLVALSISISAAIAEDSTRIIYLNVGNVSAQVSVPDSWGEYYPIDPDSAPSAEVAIAVMDGVPFKTAAWNKVVPKIEPDVYEPSITITLADLSAGFRDDADAKLPEGERPPAALTAKEKEAAVTPLEAIYKASSVDPENFTSPEMEPVPGLRGAWWGGLVGVLDILDLHYIENGDKSLRGVSFLYTEGGDINFSVSSRIILWSPELKSIVLLDLPLFSFPEIQGLNEAVGAAGAGPALMEQYKKGLAFIKDRKAWASTPLGKLVADLDAAAKSAVVTRK